MDRHWQPTVTQSAIHLDNEQSKAPARLAIEVAALSDIGCLRANNEDSFGYDLSEQLFVVCDGMGGMAAGEVASRAAVDHVLSLYSSFRSTGLPAEKRLFHAIQFANRAVWSAAEADDNLRGMGSTLVAACIEGDLLVVGNVGDSRAYFLRDGSCVQITQDHSWSVEQTHSADRSTRASLQQFITRAIGVDATVQPDLFFAHVRTGDLVLLATDGLSRYAESEEIAREISGDATLADSCRRLIEIARHQGGEDNITCLLLRIE
jgi:serine/threonine protein phosphatase PrpC